MRMSVRACVRYVCALGFALPCCSSLTSHRGRGRAYGRKGIARTALENAFAVSTAAAVAATATTGTTAGGCGGDAPVLARAPLGAAAAHTNTGDSTVTAAAAAPEALAATPTSTE